MMTKRNLVLPALAEALNPADEQWRSFAGFLDHLDA